MSSYIAVKRTGLLHSSSFSFEMWTLAILNNVDHFFFFKSKCWYSEKFVHLLDLMLEHVQFYETEIKKLKANLDRFDVTPSVHGNGFRSFDIIFERLFNECYLFCKELCTVRNSLFFIPGLYIKKLEASLHILDAIKPALNYILKMIEENNTSQPLVVANNITTEEILKDYGLLDQTAFYGQFQSFYFCGSFRKILFGVGVLMASFSELYQQSGGPLSRAICAIKNGIKYSLYPDLRSQQIVSVAQASSVEFLQAFWRLSETHFMKVLPKWICPKLEVQEELWIPSEPISITTSDGSKIVQVAAPSSHIPTGPVRCLLMSYKHREGQIVKGKCGSSPLSPALLFHCHGGGFVSQRPDTHEIYLRHWAQGLDVPIFSVDYSLAPEAPFPRALEEMLLAYVWALNNPEKLGWTGERLCFAGDSAGGNILMGILIKIINLKIRKPDGILCAYSPLILDLIPSPSRLLCWVDPLIPIGFMISCLDAYVGAMHTDNNEYMPTPSRVRKASSISEMLDYTLLKDAEWLENGPNEPDTKLRNKKSLPSTPEIPSNHMEFAKIQNFSPLTYYLHYFRKSYSKCKLNSDIDENYGQAEDVFYSFPKDIVFDIKQRCYDFYQATSLTFAQRLKKNKYYKQYVSPYLPSSLFNSKPQAIELPRVELSVAQKIRRLKLVSKNPYISPLLASDDLLKEMPQIYFVSLNFDPCLDDSITFAKRMASVGKPVVMNVLDGLPHGFLNFLPFSKEAHDGSDLCVKQIKEILKL